MGDSRGGGRRRGGRLLVCAYICVVLVGGGGRSCLVGDIAREVSDSEGAVLIDGVHRRHEEFAISQVRLVNLRTGERLGEGGRGSAKGGEARQRGERLGEGR